MSTFLLTLLLLTSIPDDDTVNEARAPVVVTTLQMDPEKPRDIVGWWHGKNGLVEVTDDGRYRRWKDLDRFSRPVEVGRWHRENHAVFWLESYSLPKTPRQRAALWLEDDALMADLDRRETYRFQKTAPSCPADGLVGRWAGTGGTLELRGDLTYHWIAPASNRPADLGGQRGRWRFGLDDRLHLEPLVANQSPALVSIRRNDLEQVVEIQSIAGPMSPVKPPPAAKPTTANPEADSIEPDKQSAGT
ncbi:MAG: hypothetical protein CMJ51_05960 [Planctomycetaceae bacterium]|nr:hypothetical protein [Planctomycetaceae bacterium]